MSFKTTVNVCPGDRLCYSAKGMITVSGFCKPPDADADDIELWLPVANGGERSAAVNVDTAKYIISLLSDCFTQLLDDENKASTLDTRHGIATVLRGSVLSLHFSFLQCDP